MKENIDLKREISELGFESQKKFAEFMGVSPRTVNRWCRGFSKVPREVVSLCTTLREKQRIEREVKKIVEEGYSRLPDGRMVNWHPKDLLGYRKEWLLIEKLENIYFEKKN
ncbi:hypothetical protein BGP_6280 [Beggiatoa sp. PS]|nr:hypothetical protein BGP_6280 [Beggiatoa sp. PS]